MKVKVSKRFQIAVPAEARKKLGIKAGDNLLVVLHEDSMYLVPEPKDYEAKLHGLHKEVWEGVDVEKYIRELREGWPE